MRTDEPPRAAPSVELPRVRWCTAAAARSAPQEVRCGGVARAGVRRSRGRPPSRSSGADAWSPSVRRPCAPNQLGERFLRPGAGNARSTGEPWGAHPYSDLIPPARDR